MRTALTVSFAWSTPPSSRRACRWASCGDMPARRFSSVSMARCERTSASRSVFTRREENRLRRRLRNFATRSMARAPYKLLHSFQGLGNCHGNAIPALGFEFELFTAGPGEAIKLGATIIFGIAPKGRYPALFLHAVQGGEERAGLNDEGTAGDLLNPAGNSEAVHFAGDQGFQNQHVEGALQQSSGFGIQVWFSPIENL